MVLTLIVPHPCLLLPGIERTELRMRRVRVKGEEARVTGCEVRGVRCRGEGYRAGVKGSRDRGLGCQGQR